MIQQKLIALTPSQLQALVAQAVEQGIAAYIAKRDEEQISQREAYRRWGRSRVDALIKSGAIQGTRNGGSANSKKYYNAHDIAAALHE